MNFLYSDEPIIACSTSNLSNAAISVLRISGFKDVRALASFFTLDFSILKPRTVYFTKLVDGPTVLDDICLTYFEAPRSYNGENILELSVHGNVLNTERILKLFLRHGFRAAGPGEFTFRALKNKKLDLSQVEGLDLLLNANSSYALEEGVSLLSGNLHSLYREIFDLFLLHKSALELSIDFSDDVGEEIAREQYRQTLSNLRSKFNGLVKRVQPMSNSLIQPEIVIAGPPNSGKSSLFNLLLSEERAIVSPVPGTTRDYLSELMEIEGVRYRLVDTAGVRETSDLIEREGVRRTQEKLKTSFYAILLINPMETYPALDELISLEFDFVIFTHADIEGFSKCRDELVLKHPRLGSIGAIDLVDPHCGVVKLIGAEINKKYLQAVGCKPILLDRHKLLILKASDSLDEYVKLGIYETDSAILSSELNTLGHCLSELIGIVSPEQILNSIFSNFCIGK